MKFLKTVITLGLLTYSTAASALDPGTTYKFSELIEWGFEVVTVSSTPHPGNKHATVYFLLKNKKEYALCFSDTNRGWASIQACFPIRDVG